MLRNLPIIFGVIFLALQFFRIEKNQSNELTNDISKKYAVSDTVMKILDGACNDCHSNYTAYPWYSSIQPVAWWLDNHVQDGKKHLNFSTFLERNVAVQNHKFEEIVEMVEKKEMPLPSYTYLGLHSEAKLSDAQRQVLIKWAKTQMDSLKAWYPADSLVLKRPSGPPPAQ
jgi:hypothetical protein